MRCIRIHFIIRYKRPNLIVIPTKGVRDGRVRILCACVLITMCNEVHESVNTIMNRRMMSCRIGRRRRRRRQQHRVRLGPATTARCTTTDDDDDDDAQRTRSPLPVPSDAIRNKPRARAVTIRPPSITPNYPVALSVTNDVIIVSRRPRALTRPAPRRHPRRNNPCPRTVAQRGGNVKRIGYVCTCARDDPTSWYVRLRGKLVSTRIPKAIHDNVYYHPRNSRSARRVFISIHSNVNTAIYTRSLVRDGRTFNPLPPPRSPLRGLYLFFA